MTIVMYDQEMVEAARTRAHHASRSGGSAKLYQLAIYTAHAFWSGSHQRRCRCTSSPCFRQRQIAVSGKIPCAVPLVRRYGERMRKAKWMLCVLH